MAQIEGLTKPQREILFEDRNKIWEALEETAFILVEVSDELHKIDTNSLDVQLQRDSSSKNKMQPVFRISGTASYATDF